MGVRQAENGHQGRSGDRASGHSTQREQDCTQSTIGTMFTVPRREGLHSQHPEERHCIHSTQRDCVHSTQKRHCIHSTQRDCVHSTQKRGTPFTAPRREALHSQHPERLCSQNPEEALCSQHPEGLCSQHPEERHCVHSTQKDCVHSTQKRGTVHTAHGRERLPAPSQGLHSLVLTGVDELHQDELLHVLVENVLQRPAPLLP